MGPVTQDSGPQPSGTRDWFHGRQLFHGPGLKGMILGWLKHTTFIVCFTSNLMPLLILKEVLVHGLEVGDLWLKRLFQTRCLLGPIPFYCRGCGEQRRLGPLHVRTVASGAQVESWQGKVVTGVREADLGVGGSRGNSQEAATKATPRRAGQPSDSLNTFCTAVSLEGRIPLHSCW